MTAIIVDDEKHCREVLELLLLKYCPDVKLVGNYATGPEAVQALSQSQPDMLFLDIEMPEMNGFELLERIEHPAFGLIFTTAYNEYAIKAIKNSALDYLLKPVDKDELILAVQRATDKKIKKSSAQISSFLDLVNSRKNQKRLAVPTLEGLIMINTGDLLYCESNSAYCKLFFINQGKPMVISKILKEVEEVLQGDDFCRIHNSYVINMRFVERYIRGEGGEVIMSGGIHLPVSRSRKQAFLDLLEMI